MSYFQIGIVIGLVVLCIGVFSFSISNREIDTEDAFYISFFSVLAGAVWPVVLVLGLIFIFAKLLAWGINKIIDAFTGP